MFGKNDFTPPTRDKYPQLSTKEEMNYNIIFMILPILVIGLMLYSMFKGN